MLRGNWLTRGGVSNSPSLVRDSGLDALTFIQRLFESCPVESIRGIPSIWKAQFRDRREIPDHVEIGRAVAEIELGGVVRESPSVTGSSPVRPTSKSLLIRVSVPIWRTRFDTSYVYATWHRGNSVIFGHLGVGILASTVFGISRGACRLVLVERGPVENTLPGWFRACGSHSHLRVLRAGWIVLIMDRQPLPRRHRILVSRRTGLTWAENRQNQRLRVRHGDLFVLAGASGVVSWTVNTGWATSPSRKPLI